MLQRTACLVVSPYTAGNTAFLFDCAMEIWPYYTITPGMFSFKPLYSLQSRLPLWLRDDRTDLEFNDDVGLNPETEGRRRVIVLSFFGRALNSFSAVALTSDRSLSTLAIDWNSLYLPNNISMFYISLHAVLLLLMLQIYRTGITFIYTNRLVWDRWYKSEVELS